MAVMEQIGRYRLVRRIGAGSFAIVWLGHDDSLDVPVAIKVLAENWADNDNVRQRFLTEARIMRRIRDRRIVQVYDIGSLDDGRPYFVMDFVDGGSLDDLRKQGVEPERALRLCAEACRALQVLHDHDIIHRDVTPGNLLLSRVETGQPTVLITDLGVAKSMIDGGATMTAGTPSYMAMEQASGIGTLDPRADIYSLTALTYAMLSGQPPFPVRTLADILGRNAAATPPPLAQKLGAPPLLDTLLVAGLAIDPGRRPPTAAVLGQALDGIADQLREGPPSRPSDRTWLSSRTAPPVPPALPTWPGAAGPGGVSSGPTGNISPTGNTPGSFVGSGNPRMPSDATPSPPVNPGWSAGPPPPVVNPEWSTAGPPTVDNPELAAYHPEPHAYNPNPATYNPDWTSSAPTPQTRRFSRPTTFYVLVGLGALALFAVTLLITVAALSR